MQAVLVLQVLIGFLKLTNACVQFELTQEVSVSDSAQVLTTYSGTHGAQLYSTCAPACLRDIRCNAFDICKDQQLCRTIRGWTPVTPGNVSAGVCQRFQMLRISLSLSLSLIVKRTNRIFICSIVQEMVKLVC